MDRIDDHDIHILRLLQGNGRLTNQELSERVGLSASQCSRRRIQLEQTSKILGYYARLSPDALGPEITGLIEVRLMNHTLEYVDDFHHRIINDPSVIDAYKTTGDADYLLKVTVTDLNSLSTLINQLVAGYQSVAHVKTSVVLNRIKEGGRILKAPDGSV